MIKDSTKSSAYNICDIHYCFKGTELFIIPNVQAQNIPYSFTVLTRYSLFPFNPPDSETVAVSFDHKEATSASCTRLSF